MNGLHLLLTVWSLVLLGWLLVEIVRNIAARFRPEPPKYVIERGEDGRGVVLRFPGVEARVK